MSILDDAYALITSASRTIGTIIPDVVIEEIHRDDLVITDHPVETGAAISDHAFKMPLEVEMRCGWSDSTGGYNGYAIEAYNELIALQEEREPFTVYTGKRTYEDMLIRSLQVMTDEKSENVLMVSVGLRQVIIVDTETTSSANASSDTQSRTAGTANSGTKQLKEVSTGRVAGSA